MEYYFLLLLFLLMGFSMYAGYRLKYNHMEDIVQHTLEALESEKIIRFVDRPDGEVEVFSGTKYYKL